MKEAMRKRMDEMDREMSKAVEAEMIQLSANVIQARMLLCIHRAGAIALGELTDARPAIMNEWLMFKLIAAKYPAYSTNLKEILKGFDKAVGDRMESLALGTCRNQLVELLGEEVADALLRKEDADSDDAEGDPGSEEG